MKIGTLKLIQKAKKINKSIAIHIYHWINLIKKFILKQEIYELYYINGYENLPPPLSRSEELKIMEKISNGDDSSREPLITHNLRLVVYIAKKFDNGGNIEDLISIGTIGLIKAVKTFCPERGIKLATYASRCIENEILMFLRKINPLKNETSFDEPLNTDCDGNELYLSDVLCSEGNALCEKVEQECDCEILNSAVENLKPRDRTIVNMRFGLRGSQEHTQKEVADILGISQSYISRLEKRIIAKLKKNLEKIV